MGYIHEMIPVLRKTSSTTRILSSSYEVELKAPKDYLIRQPGFWKRKLLWCFFLLLFNQKTFFFANKNLLSATQKTFDEITSTIKWSSASLSFFFSWRHFKTFLLSLLCILIIRLWIWLISLSCCWWRWWLRTQRSHLASMATTSFHLWSF